jgi:hypothetical protein
MSHATHVTWFPSKLTDLMDGWYFMPTSDTLWGLLSVFKQWVPKRKCGYFRGVKCISP